MPGHRWVGVGYKGTLEADPARPRARTVRAEPRALRPAGRGRSPPGSAVRRVGHSDLGERAEHYPLATDNIPQMVDIIKRLRSRGLTYESDGSIYFNIHQKFS